MWVFIIGTEQSISMSVRERWMLILLYTKPPGIATRCHLPRMEVDQWDSQRLGKGSVSQGVKYILLHTVQNCLIVFVR